MIKHIPRGGVETRRIVTINRRHQQPIEPPKPEPEKVDDKPEPRERPDVAMSIGELSRKYLGGNKR